ncbi:hypothetical protein [Saccharopolyspora sp. NPDC050642]|uniref:hypothetical protein n=1 Tax=Saccharopolyspora sp. NPDC050642 TaxID=3157099 RepID=UPI00340063F9
MDRPTGVLQDGVAYTWQVTTVANLTSTTSSRVGHVKVDLRIGNHGPSPTDDVGPVEVNLANGNISTQVSSPSKEALVLEFLKQRDARWRRALVDYAGTAGRGA